MAAATDRRLRLALVSALAITLVVALWAAWSASRPSPRSTAWILVGTLSLSAALGWWALRRARQEIADLRERNQVLQARLTSFSADHQTFLRRFAHQIKTPLTIVVNKTELIRRRSTDAAAVEGHARGIVDYLLHVSGLIDGFLRLGSPSTPTDTSEHVPIPVHDLVVDAVQRTQSVARSCGVDVVTSLMQPESGRDAPEFLGDRALIATMLESLLRHAVHRTRCGSRVIMRVEAEGDEIVLVVRDSGAAIHGSDTESVLESFLGTREGAEPVMGPAIARLVVEHHGGSISVRNHAEGGCEVEVRLPRHEVGRRPAAAHGAPVRTPAAADRVGSGQRYAGGRTP